MHKQAMTTLSQAEALQREARNARIVWLADNPGIITRVAEEHGVTQPFVSDVFHGRRKSRDSEIEKRFAELGAPGFTLPEDTRKQRRKVPA
jgi:hypothetical protein